MLPTLAIAGLAALLVVVATFPGILNADSAEQLRQAATGAVDDWHPPFTVMLWSLLLHVLPGAVGLLLLQMLLIWGSCIGLALLWRRRLGNAALLLALVPLAPGICNFLGNVQVDTLLVGWLLAGTVLGCMARRTASTSLRVLACLCLVCGVLTRLNAVFCIVPLLLYLNADLGRRRNLAFCLLVLLSLPLLNRAEIDMLQVRRTSVADSVKTYNLLALSFREHEVLLPGRWSALQSRRIVEGCYSPVQWDTAWLGQCRFVFDTLQAQHLWGTSRLTRAWLLGLARHPLGFVSIQLASFRQAMFDPNSTILLWPAPNPWNDALPRAPGRLRALWPAYIGSAPNLALSRPWLAVLLSGLGTVLILRRPRPFEGAAGLGIAVLLSGQIYLIGFFAYGISAEYRYYSWSGFCAVIGLLLAILCPRDRRPPGEAAAPSARLPAEAALCIAAIAASLVLTAWMFQLPRSLRAVSVRALDAHPVHVLAIHDASEPGWHAPMFEGSIDSAGWPSRDGAYVGGSAAPPLTDRLSLPGCDIELRLATGPGLGTAMITAGDRLLTQPTGAATSGTVSVLLPPPASSAFGGGFTLRWTGGLTLCIAVLFMLGRRATLGRAHRSRTA